MRNFIAVLKDSFREAVDGFLIWLMLILSALAIIAIASFGFEKESAETSFRRITSEFNKAFLKRGSDGREIGTRIKVANQEMTTPIVLPFEANNVQKTDGSSGVSGTYTMRITVNKPLEKKSANPWDRVVSSLLTVDNFRMLLASWAAEKPEEREYIVKIPKFNTDTPSDKPDEKMTIPKPEAVPEGMTAAEFIASKNDTGYQSFTMPDVKPESMKKVDTETMIAFLKQQFLLHGGIDDVDVTRVNSVAEPQYQFDVTARVKGIPTGWSYNSSVFFGSMPFGSPNRPIGQVIIGVQDNIVNTLGASIIFVVSVILTAFFIPNMLRKGAVDLLIVKPISRWQILLYKYIGGCTFVFLVISFTIFGVWAVMWLRSGVMNSAFLLSIPILTFTFMVLYAVSMLISVLTRSAIAAIVITCLFMFFMWGVGLAKSICDISRNLPESPLKTGVAFNTTVDILNAGLPRYNDVMKLNSRLMGQDVLTPAELKRSDRLIYPSWGEALGISFAWIVGLYLLSYWRFATRDP